MCGNTGLQSTNTNFFLRKEDLINIGLLSLFNKNQITRKKAICFVDYEHWYISLDKHFNIKPNIKEWVDELNSKYDVVEMTFFGDFSSPGLQGEINKIRGFTNKIVETKNGNANYKKDFTDFIILDHIYQSAMLHNQVDVFVIFTGDGHFSSAALFLKNTCKKEVGIYGIKSGFSRQLKQAASWCVELPCENDELLPYERLIMQSLYQLEQKSKRRIYPSFIKTIEAVEKSTGVSQNILKLALERLIEQEYIVQRIKRVSYKQIKVLVPNWEKSEKDGLYTRGYIVKVPAYRAQN